MDEQKVVFGQKPKFKEEELTEQLVNKEAQLEELKRILSLYSEKEREVVFHGLASKNKSAKRRAVRKIEKASRRRNRR